MENKSHLPENDNLLKWLTILAIIIYAISFMPAGASFENAKTNYRSSSGPQPMSLDGGTEFFQALSNSFTTIQAGYGAFTRLFNQESGEKMILMAGVKSYPEPYNSTSSWRLGLTIGMLLRLSILIGLIYWVRKL